MPKMLPDLRIVIAVIILPLAGRAQDPLDSIKLLIASNRTSEALPLAQQLVQREPLNPHANYFLGLCHMRLGTGTDVAIPHLEQASAYYAKPDIDPGMAEPELVWYYLVLAYSRKGDCARAQELFRTFMNVYSQDDDSYPTEARHWMELCYDPDRMRQELKLLVAQNETDTPQKQRLVSAAEGKRIVTREHVYTTRSVLYGVQVAASAQAVYAAQLKALKNVGVYVDENGIFRYVIGNLIFRSQAEKLLEEVRQAGYPDAFIVDISGSPAFKEEVVSMDDRSMSATLSGPIEFRVQIGAFTEAFPDRLAEVYLHVDGIKEHRENGLTTLQVGPFLTYAGAQAERERLRSLGHDDAFVTAFNQGRRVPMRLALVHAEMDGLVPEKRK
jgi:tetratricopeptide (TPR) repeat protein